MTQDEMVATVRNYLLDLDPTGSNLYRYTTDFIVSFLKEGAKDFSKRSYCCVKYMPVTLVAGTRYYQPSSMMIAVDKNEGILYNNKNLTFWTVDLLNVKNPKWRDDTGGPEGYFEITGPDGSFYIGIVPLPDATYTIDVICVVMTDVLTDIPRQYEYAPVYFAGWKIATLDNLPMAGELNTLYVGEVSMATTEYRKKYMRRRLFRPADTLLFRK